MSTDPKAAKSAERVEVTLTGTHTHEGVDKIAGDKIHVTAKQKSFLIAFKKVADPAAAEVK